MIEVSEKKLDCFAVKITILAFENEILFGKTEE